MASSGIEGTTMGTDAGRTQRVATRASSLADYVGSHPTALRKIFGDGRATDPGELGDAPSGRLLAFEPLSGVFLLARPLVRALAGGHFPWSGKVFDHGGNSGQNVIFGRRALRFRAEVGPSDLDGAPALLFHYEDAAFKNPWPFRDWRGELRTIGDGVAIGPASFAARGGDHRVMLWWGLAIEGS